MGDLEGVGSLRGETLGDDGLDGGHFDFECVAVRQPCGMLGIDRLNGRAHFFGFGGFFGQGVGVRGGFLGEGIDVAFLGFFIFCDMGGGPGQQVCFIFYHAWRNLFRGGVLEAAHGIFTV